jgi:hypothetical protein
MEFPKPSTVIPVREDFGTKRTFWPQFSRKKKALPEYSQEEQEFM